jgi:hypothetical protein
MRKALLLCLVVAAILVMASATFAADIGVTVTLQSVGVSVSPTTWPIGIIAAGGTASQACTATNTGNVNENFTIITSGSSGWTAGAASALNVFVIAAGSTVLTGSPQTLATGVTPTTASPFTLNFTAPAVGSAAAQQSFTVTVAASAAS